MNPSNIQCPPLLLLLGVMFGVIYNNGSINHLDTRMTDLSSRLDKQIQQLANQVEAQIAQLSNRVDGQLDQLSKRFDGQFDHLSTRIDDLVRNEEIRHNDFKDFIKSEVRRLEDR